uniref:Uncharacterized protein LOC114331403 n=1 Tax=Diabrotica virgifera virgifera TaxID=50390 RepID=A0A6P7FV29_DIAVI
MELRQIIKSYLNRQGKNITRFKDNTPGIDWVKSFLSRHKDLTARIASNIKRSRAALNADQMTEYIENLRQTITGVEPDAIFNYDETNLTDDPGKNKVLTKRGVKYPERICNSSKSSISLMMCGNAAGELLPPYVVYKSKNLWDTGTENGPSGKRYANTASGWFESQNVQIQAFKCGIVPCDVTPLLERLKTTKRSNVITDSDSTNNKSSSSDIENTFIQYLEDKRKEATKFKTQQKKGSHKVPAGQSIAHSEISLKDLTEASTSTPHKAVEPEIVDDSEENNVLDDHFPVGRDSSDDEINEVQEMEE